MTMKIDNAVVLVTGANRGLGLAFTKEALARGARKVYAGARDPASVTLPGVIPVKLDVTNPADVARVAAELGDVTLLINNAGVATMGGFLAPNSVESARAHMETNFFGPLLLSQAFAGVRLHRHRHDQRL
jgi:NAD(P)-dependent dehydrogenase (short-subunit alcohol dehydrogenase family)